MGIFDTWITSRNCLVMKGLPYHLNRGIGNVSADLVREICMLSSRVNGLVNLSQKL